MNRIQKFWRYGRLFASLACIVLTVMLAIGATQSVARGLLLGGTMSLASLATIVLLVLRWASLIVEQDEQAAADAAAGRPPRPPSQRPHQFRLSTLLLLTALMLVFLAAAREIVMGWDAQHSQRTAAEQIFSTFALATAFSLGMFLPWLFLADFVLHLLARLVRRPWGRRLASKLFRSPKRLDAGEDSRLPP